VAFNPPPANLTDPEGIGKLTDAELREVLTKGKRSMPAFGTVLKPAEIDSLISYLRKLSDGGADMVMIADADIAVRFVDDRPLVDIAEVAAILNGDSARAKVWPGPPGRTHWPSASGPRMRGPPFLDRPTSSPGFGRHPP